MVFFVTVAILAIIAYSVYRLIRQESERRERRRIAEEDFLAQARANPRGEASTIPGPTAARSAAQHAAGPAPGPVLATAAHMAGGTAAAMLASIPRAEPVAMPLAPPQDGACHFCRLPVDLRANDQRRWGVKIQEPASDRLTWVHFHCLASRLANAEHQRQALAELIAAFDATLSGATEESASAATPTLKDALDAARRTLGLDAGSPA